MQSKTNLTTLPHNLNKYILLIVLKEPSIDKALQKRLFTSEKPKKYHAWSCQNVCDALTFLLDNILFDLASSCIDK